MCRRTLITAKKDAGFLGRAGVHLQAEQALLHEGEDQPLLRLRARRELRPHARCQRLHCLPGPLQQVRLQGLRATPAARDEQVLGSTLCAHNIECVLWECFGWHHLDAGPALCVGALRQQRRLREANLQRPGVHRVARGQIKRLLQALPPGGALAACCLCHLEITVRPSLLQ